MLVLLWREDWRVGFGVTAFTAIALYLMLRLQVVAVPWWRPVRATSAVLYGVLGEQFGGHRGHPRQRRQPLHDPPVHRDPADLAPPAGQGTHGFALLWGTNIANYVFGSALVFWLGSLLFGNGTLTLGSVYLIWYYVSMAREPMDEIRTQMEDFQKAGAGVSRVQELLDTRAVLAWSGDRDLPAGPLAVRFESVEFSYDDEAGDGPVLHDVSFSIEPGRVLGRARPHRLGQDDACPVCSTGSTTRQGGQVRRGRRRSARLPSCAEPAPPHRRWSPRTSSCSTPPCATT